MLYCNSCLLLFSNKKFQEYHQCQTIRTQVQLVARPDLGSKLFAKVIKEVKR